MAGGEVHEGIIEMKFLRIVPNEDTHWQSQLSSPYMTGKTDPTRHQREERHVRWRGQRCYHRG